MMENKPFVIAGAGLAGATAARTLREEGHDGGIVLLGAEQHEPYIRPPLSKAYLAGKEEASAALVQEPGWYEENKVDLRQGVSAASLDTAAGSVRLSDGSVLEYGKLLLATGAAPRRLDFPGSDLAGVHYLRSLEDSAGLKAVLASGGRHLVVIGSGWIGMEVAATARTLGNEVTVVGRDKVPLRAALGTVIGNRFADKHRTEGVIIRTGIQPLELAGEDGRVTAVVLDGGERLAADAVLIAAGAVPNTALAEAAGLAVSNGIDADESLRTSAEHVYTAGDVANAYHSTFGAPLRSEHWANAIEQGKTAAKAMLGQDAVNDAIPYFYTDQFDIGMEYSGYFPWATADPVIRGNLDSLEFIAFWLQEGRVIAGMNVNVWDVQEPIQDLIRSRRTVAIEDLTDTAKELTSL
ncbi:FAD-dependent pyridine nucleotide-disulfide oxidoreductase [Arthrobacter crystallopoietes BAB-32]|uniref:FAD-dependent pyridine nucleotide-disulfide oxidoreductase n=1 Tax=Arthrobacter crystallopoietes BAB-32 TaxID=1246476 RepID=N1V5H1_9MICC|nr:FAD-dependent oxidoreductase [Arthrobacter crystallopoietes]EMY33513.1 FAD-dependent pyridine nucleotide-disulfide oxidoreductase [Arthrobacter crystallopoietes BAB-32]